ncbi:MAG: nucleotidyltransferase family protein [Pseudomonadota bacterium]
MGPIELELQQRLERIVRGTPWLFTVLETIHSLELPDGYLAAGAIRNTVWDALHGSTSLQPVGDLDVIYFSPANISNDAEDTLRAAFPQYEWEVTNQASVHHWQSRAAGYDIPAYDSIAKAMASWPETATAVGVRLGERGAMEIIAPHGLVDLFALTVRPSPAASDPSAYASRLRQKAWHLRWSRLLVMQPTV